MEYLKLRWGVGFIWSAMLIELTDRVILGSRRLNRIKYKKKWLKNYAVKHISITFASVFMVNDF